MSQKNRSEPIPPQRLGAADIISRKIVIAWIRSRRWQAAVERAFGRRHLVWALDASDLLTEARAHQDAAILIETWPVIDDQTASCVSSLLLRRRMVIPLGSPDGCVAKQGWQDGMLGLPEPVGDTHALDRIRRMILQNRRAGQREPKPLERLIESSLPWSRFASDNF